MTNEELLQKAITAAEALATHGKLQPAQADKFLDYVINESVMKNNVRVVRFRNEKLEIDKIGINNRVMWPAVEYVAPQDRLGVSTSKIQLQPQEVITAFDISDTFKEVNIEGDDAEDHLMRLFATGWQNNGEEQAIRGDLLGEAVLESDIKTGGDTAKYIKDPLLAMFDGWWRKADGGHSVDVGGTGIGLTVFGEMIRAMPQKFRRDKSKLRFFVPSDLAQVYIEKIATRQTPKGDRAAEGETQTPFGVPLVEVPLLEAYPKVVEHVVLPGTTAVALRYKPVVSASELVFQSTLDATPTTAYVEGTDYNMDYVNGTIARDAGGSIGDGDTVKITYQSYPQIVLTHWQNFILAYGRDDMRIERARNIHKRANEYVMTGKVDVQVEEVDALVKAVNVGGTV